MRQGEQWRLDNGAVERLPIGDQTEVETTAQLSPQAGLALRRRYGGLKQPAAMLLDLIDQKRQHHEVHEHGAEVVVAVTEVVLEVVALVFEGVEGFVLDFPACAGSSHEGHEVVFMDGDIRDPREVGHRAVGGVLPVLEEIDLEVEVGVVERRTVEIAETVAESLLVG